MDEAVKTKNKEKQNEAIKHLEKAAEHWLASVESTQQYQNVSLLHIRNFKFTGEMYYQQV